jgi:hypothetical protein
MVQRQQGQHRLDLRQRNPGFAQPGDRPQDFEVVSRIETTSGSAPVGVGQGGVEKSDPVPTLEVGDGQPGDPRSGVDVEGGEWDGFDGVSGSDHGATFLRYVRISVAVVLSETTRCGTAFPLPTALGRAPSIHWVAGQGVRVDHRDTPRGLGRRVPRDQQAGWLWSFPTPPDKDAHRTPSPTS